MVKRISTEAVANDLVMRLLWEREIGADGYPRNRPQEVEEQSHSSAPENKSSLAALREEIGDCTRCSLHRGRANLVFGEGHPEARLVFVGEGPGRDEDRTGRPFVGAAGQLLDRIIVAMGLERGDVYICNVVKCRPPSNRVPEEEERMVCGKFLLRQLEIIRPEAVVSLGGTATQFLLRRSEPLGRLRGRWHDVDGHRLMPTYHPAYLLRNPPGKRAVWEDMQKVMKLMGLEPGESEKRG